MSARWVVAALLVVQNACTLGARPPSEQANAVTASPAASVASSRPQTWRVRDLAASHPYRQLARALGRLDLRVDDETIVNCSTVLVQPGFILTNYHCVRRSAERARLLMGYTGEGEATWYDIDPEPVEASEILDFALLRAPPELWRNWPAVEISLEFPRAGTSTILIHHPEGEPALIGECRIGQTPIVGVRQVQLGCYGRPGSSGSPAFDRRGRLVALTNGTLSNDTIAATSAWDIFVHSHPLRTVSTRASIEGLETGSRFEPDGTVYRGELIDGRPDGWGERTYEDGGRVEGWFVAGEPNGRATATWPNGRQYRGQFFHGRRDGYGAVRFEDGDTFTGTFRDGRPVRGVYTENGVRYRARIHGQTVGPGDRIARNR